MMDNRAKHVPLGILPTSQEAVYRYVNVGGAITSAHEFGVDLLADFDEKKKLRHDGFVLQYSFERVFHLVVNGNNELFKEALLFFIDITYRLSII